jgi:hypothetical protein
MQRETWGPASPLGVRDRRPYPPDEMPRVPPLEVPDVPERLPGPIREVPPEPDEIPGPSPTEVPEPGSRASGSRGCPDAQRNTIRRAVRESFPCSKRMK